jgi:hypothetical protein
MEISVAVFVTSLSAITRLVILMLTDLRENALHHFVHSADIRYFDYSTLAPICRCADLSLRRVVIAPICRSAELSYAKLSGADLAAPICHGTVRKYDGSK